MGRLQPDTHLANATDPQGTEVNFAMDDDVLELVGSIGDFFDRRSDARTIAVAASQARCADRGRWSALCEMGLPVLRLPEPEGIGAGLLEATAVAERIGAVLLPEPAIETIVLANAWAAHPEASHILESLCDGTRLTAYCGFDRGTLAPSGELSGRIRIAAFDVIDAVAVPVADEYTGSAALAIVDATQLFAPISRSNLDPTRPVATVELDGVEPLAVLRLSPGVADRIRRELAVLTVAELAGGMQHVLSATREFVATREQFGRAIGSFQAIKHRLADMYALTEQARALAQFAAIDCATGADPVAIVESATRWIPRSAITVCEEAIHLHGAMGYSWEVDIHLHLRRALAVKTLLSDEAPPRRLGLATTKAEAV